MTLGIYHIQLDLFFRKKQGIYFVVKIFFQWAASRESTIKDPHSKPIFIFPKWVLHKNLMNNLCEKKERQEEKEELDEITCSI